MIRMTFTLMVALWAAFVIWGQPLSTQTPQASTTAPAPVAPTGPASAFAVPTIVTDASGRAVAPQASTRNLSDYGTPRLINQPIVVSLIEPAQPIAAPAPVLREPVLDLYTVTGNRVNLRGGPSTANPVVGALTFGAVAEALSDPVNGWLEIRDMNTGLTGYMAARFLDPL